MRVAECVEVMLDTNIVSSLLREDAHSENVGPRLADAETIGLSSIVLAEVEIGLQQIRATKRGKRLRANFDRMLGIRTIVAVPFGPQEAVEAGRLYGRRKKGRVLSFQDVALAASAKLHGAKLITADQDFAGLPRGYLRIENWLLP